MKPKCTKCKKEISRKDDACPNCGADLKKQRKTANIGILIFALVFLSFFWMCSGEDDTEIVEHTKSEALITSHEFVKRQLKAPSTAEFGYGSDRMVEQLNDSTFIIRSYVDSQNSFGAMIRSNYECKLYFDKEGTGYLLDLNIE